MQNFLPTHLLETARLFDLGQFSYLHLYFAQQSIYVFEHFFLNLVDPSTRYRMTTLVKPSLACSTGQRFLPKKLIRIIEYLIRLPLGFIKWIKNSKISIFNPKVCDEILTFYSEYWISRTFL